MGIKEFPVISIRQNISSYSKSIILEIKLMDTHLETLIPKICIETTHVGAGIYSYLWEQVNSRNISGEIKPRETYDFLNMDEKKLERYIKGCLLFHLDILEGKISANPEEVTSKEKEYYLDPYYKGQLDEFCKSKKFKGTIKEMIKFRSEEVLKSVRKEVALRKERDLEEDEEE